MTSEKFPILSKMNREQKGGKQKSVNIIVGMEADGSVFHGGFYSH